MEGLNGFLSKNYQGFFIFLASKKAIKNGLKTQPFYKLKFDDASTSR